MTSYITNWATLIKLCEENCNKIDTGIYQKVSNISLKRNLEEISKRLKLIATALDEVQNNACIISEAVTIWKKLEELKALNLDEKNHSIFFQAI